jgi:tRNA (cytidine/uridine-2'-O-)-methyltransferase
MLDAGYLTNVLQYLVSAIQHPVIGTVLMTTQSDPYDPALHIVLHQPEIPYNTGSVGRTCVAVGAKLWLVRPLGFRVDDYYLRRAGLDYWQHLAWQVVDSWEELLGALANRRIWLFTKKATQPYTAAAYERGDVLVFGSESAGLPDSILAEYADSQLRIPTRADVRSLNLSNAVAVASYEALRQWEALAGQS